MLWSAAYPNSRSQLTRGEGDTSRLAVAAGVGVGFDSAVGIGFTGAVSRSI